MLFLLHAFADDDAGWAEFGLGSALVARADDPSGGMLDGFLVEASEFVNEVFELIGAYRPDPILVAVDNSVCPSLKYGAFDD